MHIRPAKPEEARVLACLAWSAKASWGYSSAQLSEWRAGLGPSAESIAQQPTLVAQMEEKIAGFCQLNIEATPVELEHLWVQPEFMGQGVGRALLLHCLACLAEAGVQELHVDSDPNAEAFYAACGAVRVGEVAAPIEGQAQRVRPQMRLYTTQPDLLQGAPRRSSN